MALNKVLKVTSDSELLSFIINTTPELASVIDLPTQGASIQPIGKIIMSNERYKNAFINALDLIGLTIIDRNYWENPWQGFTERGILPFGQSVREMIVDIADVFDYNQYADSATHYLENVVPNVYNYVHELNYQKFYKATTSDQQMMMAFNTEGGLMDLLEKITESLYEGYKYDKYIVDKYMLCRRIVDGTMTSIEIEDYATLEPRERVAFIKNISNLMTFRSPKYNPAGLRIATAFENQIAIVNTDFMATMETSVWATSFFRNDAELKTQMALIDGFDNHDDERLTALLGTGYVEFTDDELASLAKVPAVIVDSEFFQDYNYALDTASDGSTDGTIRTNSFNPESLKNTHWLHTWKVLSTSPFKQGVVFVAGETPAVSAVSVSPSESTVSAGMTLQLSASVTTTGFANKAVVWSVTSAEGEDEGKVTVNPLTGLVTIPADYTPEEDPDDPQYQIVITATSVFDDTKTDTATITVL